MFSTCSFCIDEEDIKSFRYVKTHQLGETLICIKNEKYDDSIRTSLSELHDPGDASALEKYYHTNCRQYAKSSLSCKMILYCDKIYVMVKLSCVLYSVWKYSTCTEPLHMVDINAMFISMTGSGKNKWILKSFATNLIFP